MKIYSVVDWDDYSSFGRHLFYLTEGAARERFVHMTTVAHRGLVRIESPESNIPDLDLGGASHSPTRILDCWASLPRDNYGKYHDVWLLLEIEIGDDYNYGP